MEPQASTNILNAWIFRTLLLAMSLSCLIGFAANTHDRLQLSIYGVSAAIESGSKTQTLPSDWSAYDGTERAQFFVKVKPIEGPQFSTELYLSKAAIEALLGGAPQQIVFAKDNPRRFIMQGDPLPKFGFAWLGLAIALLAVFIYSLKLR